MNVGIDVTAAVDGHLSGVGYHIIRLLEAMDGLADPSVTFTLFFPFIGRTDADRARERMPRAARYRLVPVRFIATGRAPVHRLFFNTWLPWRVRSRECNVFHGPAHVVPPLGKLPTVVTIHDLAFFRPEIFPPQQTAILREKVAASVARASAVVSLSQNTRMDVETLLGRSEGVHVIYGAGNYPTTEERRPGSADAAALDSVGITKPYVLYVGDFNPRKNLPYLVRAFAGMQLQTRSDAQLVLAGQSSTARENLLQEAERAGLRPGQLVLPGRVSDDLLRILYRNAHVFALFSLMEGFTLVTLEAMAYGVPVVATRTSSIEEGTGPAAELVPLDDVDSAARGLVRAFAPGERRSEMQQLGLERVGKFTWVRTAAETLSLYQALAGRRLPQSAAGSHFELPGPA